MIVRERTEALEYQILSPFAAKSKEAVRKRPDDLCPFRTAYQRDRDRILHSKSFRRLKHKTQVYIVSGDHYRTRMTHSLEVSQISRTIARGLQLNEDLTEAIAMGHDVGHTPFGHVGEEVMHRLIGHFRHNEQSLRVVDVLEKNGLGLNLTEQVKDGILHHSGPGMPSTLEGKIVRTADRIAYLCHDYDDGMRSGMLKPSDLPALVQKNLGTDPSEMITGMVQDMILSSTGTADISCSERMQETMKVFRQFMFERVYHSDVLAKERRQAGFVLEELFLYYKNNFTALPTEFLSREKNWSRETIVVDYIAGLTDSYAIQLFQEIFMPPVGFVMR